MTAVCYGIVFPASRGILTPAKYCAEAEAFFARLSTQPSAARKLLYDTLIRALVAAGVWSKLDALYVLAAADQATALTNLVQSSYGATAVNSPTFTADQGFTGASTKYIDTGFNPTTASGPQFVQDSATVFAWGDRVAANGGGLVGYANASARLQLLARYTDNKFYGYVNAAGGVEVGSQTDGSGLTLASRTASNLTTGYKNGASIGTDATASAALVNSTISILEAAAVYYTGKVYCAGIGSGMTAGDVAALYAALHIYLQAVAGVA